jgi:hypothetical protein
LEPISTFALLYRANIAAVNWPEYRNSRLKMIGNSALVRAYRQRASIISMAR